MSIRGVGTTLIDTVQPGVGIFIDGIYQPNTSYLNSPVVDVERIEVLKGPQGTLFGNNTLGGAINVITRAPTDEFQGRATATYAGPDNYQTYGASISGPIVEGSLRGRLAASYHTQDGFSENTLAGGNARPLETQVGQRHADLGGPAGPAHRAQPERLFQPRHRIADGLRSCDGSDRLRR